MYDPTTCTEPHYATPVYDPTTCVDEGCSRTPEPCAFGWCTRHLFRWALRCRHESHDPTELDLAA